ncbi:MAG: tetratricopeptide repeat protein, partial [Thiogranum sp.]
LDKAIDSLESLADTRFQSARDRGFDFSRDYRMLNELGRTLFDRARQQRGASRKAARLTLLQQAKGRFEQVLEADPENVTAHYNLALIYAELDQPGKTGLHRQLHEKYRPDDHAIERAVTVHRGLNPAANHAAEAVAIYDLQRADTVRPEPGDLVAESAQSAKKDSPTHELGKLISIQANRRE